MLLQNKDIFQEFAIFDEDTGSYKLMLRSELPSAHAQGVFAFLSKVFCAVFRSAEKQLALRIGDQQFSIDQISDIKVSGSTQNRLLHVKVYSHPEITVRYALNITDVTDDLTPFVDLEDFDFGVFLVNVSTDPLRQMRLKESWQ